MSEVSYNPHKYVESGNKRTTFNEMLKRIAIGSRSAISNLRNIPDWWIYCVHGSFRFNLFSAELAL